MLCGLLCLKLDCSLQGLHCSGHDDAHLGAKVLWLQDGDRRETHDACEPTAHQASSTR